MAAEIEVDELSELESRFEQYRRVLGLTLAPLAFGGVWLAEFSSLSPQAHRLAAVMAGVVVLWVTEALPMPVTALIGASLAVVLRVAPAKVAFAPFADPIMFLFIGSFILARAIFLNRLDRRLAFGVLSLRAIGTHPSRILFAYGAVTACMSGWISNTATTAMMFPIGLSILGFLFEQQRAGGAKINRRYATGMMLMTSFAASIGGLATPIGTPPNLIGLGFIRELLGHEIPFVSFSFFGAPIVLLLFLFLFAYLNFLCPAGQREIAGSRELLAAERRRLGPWTAGQRSTLAAFLVTVAMWVVPGLIAFVAGIDSDLYQAVNGSLPEAVAAILGASLLFLLPGDCGGKAINWREAEKIEWGIVLLYGGGFALGVLSNETGLAKAIGEGIASLLPLADSPLALLVATTLVATLISEATSNTASATIVVPVAISIAQAFGADPLEPALGATFGASLGFMLPVSTPCNAIVFGSGYVPLTRMIRYGLLLDVAGVAVIVTLVHLLTPLVRAGIAGT